MPLRLLPFAMLVLLVGCSQIAEPRVRAALVGAGLSPRNADCMAGRMVDRLSIGQLRSLEKLSEGGRAALERRSLPQLVEAVRRTGDGEAVAVTASSAALCATGLAR